MSIKINFVWQRGIVLKCIALTKYITLEIRWIWNCIPIYAIGDLCFSTTRNKTVVDLFYLLTRSLCSRQLILHNKNVFMVIIELIIDVTLSIGTSLTCSSKSLIISKLFTICCLMSCEHRGFKVINIIRYV